MVGILHEVEEGGGREGFGGCFAAGAEQDLAFVAEALQRFLGRRQVAIPERVEHCLRRLGSVDGLLALLLVEDTLDENLHLSLPAHHVRCALVALFDEPD